MQYLCCIQAQSSIYNRSLSEHEQIIKYEPRLVLTNILTLYNSERKLDFQLIT